MNNHADSHDAAPFAILREPTEQRSGLVGERERELRRRASQQAAVAELGQRALKGAEPDELIELAVALVAETLQAEFSSVLEVLPGGEFCLLRDGLGWGAGVVGTTHVLVAESSPAAAALCANTPTVIRNLNADARFDGPSLLRDHGIVSGVSVVIPGNGHPFGVLGAYTTSARLFNNQDIYFLQSVANVLASASARQREEKERARLSRAVEQATEMIVITDPQGNIVYANPAFERVTGYTVAEARGKNPRLLNSGRHSPEFYHELWATLTSGQAWSGHFTNRRKDGTLFEEEAVISPVRDTAGRIVNYVAVKRDVTYERQIEQQFRQAQKMDAVGRLAGGVAHDFNNLLTAINGYSELLLRRLDPASPLRRHAEEIARNAFRAAALTRQLLAFSRKQVMQPVVLDVNALVAEMEKLLRRLIREDIVLRTAPAPAPAFIRADPGQIEQVIMNLVVNARDAIVNRGTITLTIAQVTLDELAARQQPDAVPGPYIRVAVSDTGTGMSNEVKAHLFEPFFTTKPQGHGTGLGLATCYGIVKQSGGYLEVSSEVGQGSTFAVMLPFIAGGSTKPSSRSIGELPHGTEAVLLVEDELAVRELAAVMLTELGYKVFKAASGPEALALLGDGATEIKLVLTDVVMPQMSGKELADKIRSLRPDVKFLFSSGHTDDAIVHHGVLEHAVRFLQKPYTIAALAHKLREALA